MPKLFLACLSFLFINGVVYSQSVVFNPMVKNSIVSDSTSYSISGYLEINDSLDIQIELVQIFPDSLHSVFSMESGFDQNLQPTNSQLQFDSATDEFSIQCGVFNHPDLMIRLMLFRNEEKIYETYFK
jgi:hypothetical protein